MKKITLFLLICMYTFSSIGMGISQFYCCGKLKTTSLSFVHSGTNKCSNAMGMAGCCKTTFKSFQIKDSHVASAAINNPVKPFIDLHLNYVVATQALFNSQASNTSYAGNAPPPLHYNIPIYIFHCAYLI